MDRGGNENWSAQNNTQPSCIPVPENQELLRSANEITKRRKKRQASGNRLVKFLFAFALAIQSGSIELMGELQINRRLNQTDAIPDSFMLNKIPVERNIVSVTCG